MSSNKFRESSDKNMKRSKLAYRYIVICHKWNSSASSQSSDVTFCKIRHGYMYM